MAYGGCEVRKRAAQVQQEKVKNNLTYAEAVKVVNDRSKQSKMERVVYEKRNEETGRTGERGVTEDTMLVNKKSFVLLIVEVINCTAQAERRSEKIQIIVKAAERFLEIKGLKCEDIRKSLSTESQSSQEVWVG